MEQFSEWMGPEMYWYCTRLQDLLEVYRGGAYAEGTDRFLYGATSSGGAAYVGGGFGGYGTLFNIDGAGNHTVLHSFNGTDGFQPNGDLFQATDGFFYGTAPSGGLFSRGTVFRIDSAGNFTLLRSFDEPSDGGQPASGLIQASDGYLYGTTRAGGAFGSGTAYKIDSAGNFMVVHSFTDRKGAPNSNLIQADDGYFYGTASTRVSKMDLNGNVTVLHVFTDGSILSAPVIRTTTATSMGRQPLAVNLTGEPFFGWIGQATSQCYTRSTTTGLMVSGPEPE